MISGRIDDESPLDYSVSFNRDPDGFVTITAHLTLDVWARYATPRKPWAEHKAHLLAMPDIHEDESERVERDLERKGKARTEDVSLTSTDLRRLGLRPLPRP